MNCDQNLGADADATTDGSISTVERQRILNCLEAVTGKPIYESQRIELGTYSSSLLADGKDLLR
jgi:hypothetical protein